MGPPTLMPEHLDGWPVTVAHDLDDVLTELDVVYVLRVQQERIGRALLPEPARVLRPVGARRGPRAERMKPDALVMHPGPMIRGSEIATAVVDGPRSLVRDQVANGVAVRMAVLWDLARRGWGGLT